MAAVRAIVHVDLDAFYASVEQLRRPELRGRPVIVGGYLADGRLETARGVVSAASYEARRFGVRSAMPLAVALRRCPQAALVPVDFIAYRAASAEVMRIVHDYTPVVEPLSLDEAYLDVTASRRRFGGAQAIAAAIRDRILAECGLHASFGVATNKTVAKVASDLRKPRGFVVVPPGTEAAFLAPLALRTLPGLGPAAEAALNGIGITTLGQLAALEPALVRRRLGEAAGTSLWERARGIDEAAVCVPGAPKSISREETFAHDEADRGVLEARLLQLAADVAARLRQAGLRARTVTLKLRAHDFTTITRQESLPVAVDADRTVGTTAVRLLDAGWDGRPVRLLGVGVSSLEEGRQLDLLDPIEERQSALDRTLDDLRRRFGDRAPHRGVTAPALRDLDFRGDDLRRLPGDAPTEP